MEKRKKERVFRFKQFDCRHERSAMKIGVDSVLLGSWMTPLEGKGKILDVGTGCGLLALMCAQRNPETAIDAIEMEQGAYEEASANFETSPWADRLTAICGDFTRFALEPGIRSTYDRIISNPPYFDSGVAQDGSARIAARHQDLLSPETLIRLSVPLLAPLGRLAMIVPTEQAEELIAVAKEVGMDLSRICEVRGRENLPSKRTMLEFVKEEERVNKVKEILNKETLILEVSPGMPTDEHRQLCKNFYLKF